MNNIIKISKENLSYEYITQFILFNLYHNSYFYLKRVKESGNISQLKDIFNGEPLRSSDTLNNLILKLPPLSIFEDVIDRKIGLPDYSITLYCDDTIKVDRGVELSEKIYLNSIYYPFIAFFEKYRFQTGKKNFYEKKTGKVHSHPWALAQLIRNLLAHGNVIEYEDKSSKLLKEVKEKNVKFETTYFSFMFKENYDKRNIKEFISPIELILLMRDMEKEIIKKE